MHFAKILSIVAILTAALLMSSTASPVPSTEHELERFEELELYGRTSKDGSLVRLKRATCDLGSFSSDLFTPNHSLCATHCILLGKRGGQCKGTVCHCRA